MTLSFQKIGVIGLGALGGYYGALLQQCGLDVHFLARSNFQEVQQNGLQIKSPKGDFAIEEVNVHQQIETMPCCDLAIIATKTTANTELIPQLSQILHRSSIILTLQNGLHIEEDFEKNQKTKNIVGGLCFLCSIHPSPNEIHHLDYGKINLGIHSTNSDLSAEEVLARVSELLERAQIEVETTKCLPEARWKKLVWNMPFNGLAVVENKNTKEVLSDPILRKLCRTLMEEVCAIAGAAGCSIHSSFIDQMMIHTDRMIPYFASMKYDYDARRPLELDTIYERPLAIAEQKGIPIPNLKALYEQICQSEGE